MIQWWGGFFYRTIYCLHEHVLFFRIKVFGEALKSKHCYNTSWYYWRFLYSCSAIKAFECVSVWWPKPLNVCLFCLCAQFVEDVLLTHQMERSTHQTTPTTTTAMLTVPGWLECRLGAPYRSPLTQHLTSSPRGAAAVIMFRYNFLHSVLENRKTYGCAVFRFKKHMAVHRFM